jgi:hypothetical protein
MGSVCSLDMCNQSARATAKQAEEEREHVDYATPRLPKRSETLAFKWEAPHR